MQTSRRSFINNIAILAAGIALCKSKVMATTYTNAPEGVQNDWALFCKTYGGDVTKTKAIIQNNIIPCQGHVHKYGATIHFQEENTIAQPIWIYWQNRKQPSDLLILFSKGDATSCLNKYELRSLQRLSNAQNPFDLIFQRSTSGHRKLFVTTTINKQTDQTFTHKI